MDTQVYIRGLTQAIREGGYGDDYAVLCVQYAERLLQNEVPVVFDNYHLALLLGMTYGDLVRWIFTADKLYKKINLPKRNGGVRELSIPTENLKHIQRWLLDNIFCRVDVSANASGFIKGRSIIDNAKRHVNKDCIISLDIKDFFPSIRFKNIFRQVYYLGYTKEVSFSLSKLVTLNRRLPQGAPTSPYLSNIICRRLDKRFIRLAEELGADYSRYADDITISGNTILPKYIPAFKKIIVEEGFQVNREKLRVRYQHQKQIVTGLIVNKGVHIPNDTKQFLRQQIYYCQKFGVNGHLRRMGSDKSNYKEHLFGLAYFIKMVEPELGSHFLKELNLIYWDY